MVDTRKVLAQSKPAAGVLTDIYTVAALTSAIVSSIVICNRAPYGCTFSLSVAVAGAGDEEKQYLYYELPIEANDTFTATIGMTLDAADVVRGYSDYGNVAFNLFGMEST